MIGPMRWQQEIRFSGVPNSQVKTKEGRSKSSQGILACFSDLFLFDLLFIFEEVKIDISKGQHKTPEFTKINPLKQVPTIVDGRFKLFKSHTILRYIACSFPSVSDH
ncbi:glutathione S-transferase T1-like isoform X2 [Carex rostrata]